MDVVTAYLELGLRLGRQHEDVIDAYYGPPELAERVREEPPHEPAALADDAAGLLAALDDAGLPDGRRRWLQAQVRGVETFARVLAGEEFPYGDEVERCYGVRPRRIAEEELERAHRALEESLPGDGPLAERHEAWSEGDGLKGDVLATVVESLTGDLRARAGELFALPAGEEVEWEFVSDEPWQAYCYYVGGLRSRVELNLDVPMAPTGLAELIAHETYPGHHTERALKEQGLVRERGCLEETIVMMPTPQSLVSEGLASLAVEILLGDEHDLVIAEHLARVGIPYDAATNRAVREARRPLERVPDNAALMLYEDGASRDETHAYLRRWGLVSEQIADHALRFMTGALERSYAAVYSAGYKLCRDWVDGDPQRFRRLLTEQLTPADLRSSS